MTSVGIIGGGIAGLTAAYELSARGYHVTVFEQSKTLGGLAYGFKLPHWQWSLEYAYHHFFTNDTHLIALLHALGMRDDILILRPKTSTLVDSTVYSLDSAQSLLSFSPLSMSDRLRTGALLAACKINPWWKPLEYVTAQTFFRALGGNSAWNILWGPLVQGKFGPYANDVSASWLWARVKKRTPHLGYIRGGFQAFIEQLAEHTRNNGATIKTGTAVTEVKKRGRRFDIHFGKHTLTVDRVLLTAPSPIAGKIAVDLPPSFIRPLRGIAHLHAQTLIITTKQPVLPDQTYWLNINNRAFPFLAAVEHTHFVSPVFYGGDHITYFGNYLPEGHELLYKSKEEVLNTFLPFIRRLNPRISKSDITDSFLFVGKFAQPVHDVLYSHKAPPLHTPVTGMYLANLDSIYPWDRGTNYAVEHGKRAADAIASESN